jgi:hypothetical protein
MPSQKIVEIKGLNAVLRALNAFPKEANVELKQESSIIAKTLMVPSYQQAARSVPHWGEILAGTVRAKLDRIPAVNIGYAGARYRLSGGATPNMLRYPSASGNRRGSFAPFTHTNWLARAEGYKPAAMQAWGDALERVVRKWNRGPG